MRNPENVADAMGIRTFKRDKGSPLYLKEDVNKFICKLIYAEDFFYKEAKLMSDDLSKAIEKTELMTKSFDDALDAFEESKTRLIEKTKGAAGALKDCAEKIGQGVARIEKTADFDRLERYVSLLERAEIAMRSLGEMEQSGKLAKIAGALK